MTINPKKLVCIFAHPDDEAFGAGGTIAKFSSEGVETHLICVTNGESFGKKSLGKIRNHELRNSAKILGVKDVVFLDFQDGGLNNNNYHKVTGKLKKILDKIKPDTLLTMDLNGISGHLDHVAVAMETSYLFERLGYVKQIMYLRQKKSIKKSIGADYFIFVPEGYDRKDINLVISTEKYFDLKSQAILAHKSQVKDAGRILENITKFPKEEYFKVIRK